MTATERMIHVRTNDGATISVDADTDQATIDILKAAPAIRFSEWHYTGNSPHGDNSGNYEDLEAWFLAAGLTLKEDDFSWLHYSIEPGTCIGHMTHRGKTIRYHAQARRGGLSNSFGYTTVTEYRMIGVTDGQS